MSENVRYSINRFRGLLEKGLFHIFGASAINKVVAFVTNILIVRFLTQSEYGVFSYAFSVYTIVNLFSSFGLIHSEFQYCVETRGKPEQHSYYYYTLTRGLVANVFLGACLVLVGALFRFPLEESGPCIIALAPLILIDYLFQFVSTALRSELCNREYSFIQSLNSVMYLTLGCFGAFFAGIAGTIAGRYLAFAITAITAIFILKKNEIRIFSASKLSPDRRSDVWKFAIGTGLASTLFQITYSLDVFLIGFFVPDPEAVAIYKVATLLPEGFLFIPNSVVIFVVPYFISHQNDPKWYSRNVLKTYLAIEIMMVPMALLLLIFAPQIISLLWGNAYLEAVVPFRILSCTMLISPLRSISTNLLSSLHAVRLNLTVGVVMFVANVVLLILMGHSWGIIGAAIAVVCSSAFGGILGIICIVRILREKTRGSKND